ncbi:MAG: Glycine cleavage system H protein [uncultured Solirubrobacteraceae bacterium]|uniref:Glycine cleavage system H protein n=1 Tax=uncultured Solirubrobacteraceae bacterium TaxID=1162706 RepID=A0A6J4S356_9ACTN|nr:MAG: Glycine cleavage system H protein [uncultured Solirubrobacteraceae bacterium]
MASYPTDLRYTDKHQWLRLDGKLAVLGITEVGAEQLGAVGFVELPYPGELFKAGELAGRVSGATSSTTITMPFTGQINSVNKALDDGAARVNDDPYGEGWIMRIEPGDPAAVEQLMDAAAYEAFVSAQ